MNRCATHTLLTLVVALTTLGFASILGAQVTMGIGDAVARPGETGVEVPISIVVEGDGLEVQSFGIVLGYDPTVIGGVTMVNTRDADFVSFNAQETFQEAGRAALAVIYDQAGTHPEWRLTSSNSGVVGQLQFCVLETAAFGAHTLDITEGTKRNGAPRRSIVTMAGQSHDPEYSTGTLVVQGEAVAGTCLPDDRTPPPVGEPPPAGPFEATYQLAGASGNPGGAVVLPLSVVASHEVRGFSYSLDFDEEVLIATGVHKIFQRPDGEDYAFHVVRLNNDNETPGNDGIDEGYAVGASIFSLAGPEVSLPANDATEVLGFEFDIRSDTVVRSTTLQFIDGAIPAEGSPPTRNVITIFGTSVHPDPNDVSMVLIGTLLKIIPEDGEFFRGDANDDDRLNIADPVFTLNALFVPGSDPLPCEDAADSNDDGTVNLADCLFTLNFLFAGGSSVLPAPYPGRGFDPTTDDGMECTR